MRIALDTRPLETGHRLRGIGAYSRNLIDALARIDGKNEYVFLTQRNPSAASELALKPGFRHSDTLIRRTDDPTRYAWFKDQWALPAAIRRSRVQLTHFLEQLGAPIIKSGPTILTVHDLIQIGPLTPGSGKNRLKLWPVHSADALIAISQAVKDDIVATLGIPPERVTVVYNGYDHDVFRPAANQQAVTAFRTKLLGSQSARYLFWVGSFGAFEPRKNLEFLVRTFVRYAETGHDRELRLVLAGTPGPEIQRLEGFVPSSLRPRVQFIGHVGHEDLAPYYYAADALVFPSLLEGFGLPPLEAMASGCPVLAANTTSLPEVVGDGGMLLDPTDEAAWQAAITAVRTGGPAMQAMIKRGVRQAQKFSWDQCAREVLAVYKAVGAVSKR